MRTENWPKTALYVIACLVGLTAGDAPVVGQSTTPVRGNTGAGVTGGGTTGGGVSGVLGANPGNQVEQIQQGAGTIDGSERFGRASRDPGAFVGADTSDTTSMFSQQQTNGAFRNNQPAFNANRNNQNTGMQQSQTPSLRRRMHVNFRHPTIAASRVSENLSSHFRRLSTSSFPMPVQVAMQGRTAILKGTVASQEQAELAVALAKLEPGVSQVQNELTINAAASSSLNGFERVPTTTRGAGGVDPIDPQSTATPPQNLPRLGNLPAVESVIVSPVASP